MVDLNKDFTNDFAIDLFKKRIAVAKQINEDVDVVILAHILKSTADKLDIKIKDNQVKVEITKKIMLDFITSIIPVVQAGDLIKLIEILNETLDTIKQFPMIQQLLKEKYLDEEEE